MHSTKSKITAASLLVALGIIYGDIGTSPLYVMSAIVGDKQITKDLIYGAVSCIFWTLTLQTTFKYIYLTLKADNKGEGGIFSLYSLVKRRGNWMYWPAILGGAALLCDGIITPPISVSSAIEGLEGFIHVPTIPIVLAIITMIFMIQRYGTNKVGSAFGPVMFVWFVMLSILGLYNITGHWEVISSLNPYWAYNLLSQYPSGFWLLGAVFLCTTGAEALYSDLGHCGRPNIRITWIFVKIALVLNYMGQAAWMLQRTELSGENPFYSMMPEWFRIPGVIISTLATIIASQALISGSFTMISEAINLGFWPKVKVKYPSDSKGQLYIPSLNTLLWAGCVGVVLYFGSAKHMEAAYGFFITVAMISTTVLLSFFLRFKLRLSVLVTSCIVVLLLMIETSFFVANFAKLKDAWVMLIVYVGILHVMWITFTHRLMSKNFLNLVNLDSYISQLRELSEDSKIEKYSTHLVYLTKASGEDHQIEKKVIESILAKKPKRADVYWFLHIEQTQEPYTLEYKVEEIVNDLIVKVTINIGFKVQPRLGTFFNYIVNQMILDNSFDIKRKPEPFTKYNSNHDFKFIVLEKYVSADSDLDLKSSIVMNGYEYLKSKSLSDIDAWGLEEADTVLEKVPLVISPHPEFSMKKL